MRLRTFGQRPLSPSAAMLLGVAMVCAAGPAYGMAHAKHAAKDQVLALETQWVNAQRAGDTAAMEKLLSPDFLGITAGGQVLTKMQQLDRMRTREVTLVRLDISDVKIKLLGQYAAIVTSLAQLSGTSAGRPLVGSFRYTHVYQRRANGMWSLTNYEATRIPGSGNVSLSATTAPAESR